MKSVLVAMAIALMAPVASAGIYYEFQQSTHSDSEHHPSTQVSGRAIIDGTRSRVDFTSGTGYPPGTYVISKGPRVLTFVDPTSKTFADVNTAAIASKIGSEKITVTNLKWELKKLDDHPIYAGVPTDHYQLVLTYDLTVMMGSVPVKQSVRTEIDKWTTVQFGDVTETFLSSGGIRTGNRELDEVIELETTKIKGFALRQSIRTMTRADRVAAEPRRGEHPFQFQPVRVTKRDLVITSIRQGNVDDSMFAVPMTYKRAEANSGPPQTQVEILSLEPVGN